MSILINGKDFKKIYDEIELWGKNQWTGDWKSDFYNDLVHCGVHNHPVTGLPIFISDVLYKTSLDYTILKNAQNVEKYEIKNGNENTNWAKSFYKVVEIVKKAQKDNQNKTFSQDKVDDAYIKEFDKILNDIEKYKGIEMDITPQEEKFLAKHVWGDDSKPIIWLEEPNSEIEEKIQKAYIDKFVNSKTIDGVIGQFFIFLYRRKNNNENKELTKDDLKTIHSIYQKIVNVLKNHPEQCKTDISLLTKDCILDLKSAVKCNLPHHLSKIHYGIIIYSFLVLGSEFDNN